MSETPQPGRTSPPTAADAIAALARQVERLETKVGGLGVDRLEADVRGVVTTVAGLAEEVAQLVASSAGDEVPPSWLCPRELVGPEEAFAVLHQLMRWAARVYLRYGDAGLPECWLWHADVIEELAWLRSAWTGAYHGPMASAQRAGDWHDRLRPGVVRRVQASAGSCSLREHMAPPAVPLVPAAEAAPAIAGWWADPVGPAPVPTGEQILAADAAHRGGGRR